MKIGEFAKKFNTTKATIRYYTDIKLLIPTLGKSYPDYDKRCVRDMEDILLYQSLGFTNKEVLNIKLLERFYITDNEQYRIQLSSIIADKIKAHERVIKDSKRMIAGLNDLEVSKTESKEWQSGISFATLDLLVCHQCGCKFDIKNANISGGLITHGDLECDCGDNFRILDGIIYSKKLDPIEISHTIEPQEDENNETFALMKKAGTIIKDLLDEFDHSKGILFTHACLDIFTMDLDESFVHEGHYFMCSTDSYTVSTIRYMLEQKKIKGVCVICSNIGFPLSPSIPYIVDIDSNIVDFMNKKQVGTYLHSFDHKQKLILIAAYLTLGHASFTEGDSHLLNDNLNKVFNGLGYTKISDSIVGLLENRQAIKELFNMNHDLEFIIKEIKK